MTFPNRVCSCLLLLALYAAGVRAQNAPIGYWTSHLPYNSALGVATDGTTVYSICKQAFFSYNTTSDEHPIPYSRIDGMSDIGMQYVAYDIATRCLVLVYVNGNIDLVKNNTFYNIPDLRLTNVPEPKTVFNVYTDNGMAYLSTSLGLIVIDLENNYILNNYKFTLKKELLPVKGFTKGGNTFYMLTTAGLFSIDKNDAHFSDLQAWHRMDSSDTFSHITSVNDRVFMSARKKIFTVSADSVRPVYNADTFIYHINSGDDNLLIGLSNKSGGVIKIMDTNFQITDTFNCSENSLQAVQLADGSIWIATPAGLKKRSGPNETAAIFPDGPSSPYSFDIYAYNKNLYIAHGGYNTTYFANSTYNGVSNYKNGVWTLYKHGTYPPFDYLSDFVALAKNESTGTLYAGSYLKGLYMIYNDGSSQGIDQSVFDGSFAYGPDAHDVISLALDKHDNLWVSLMFANRQLYVKTPENIWYGYKVPGVSLGATIITDDSDLIWMAGAASDGLVAYYTNKTLGDVNDDVSYKFSAGKGKGNLPANKVNCLAKDKNNYIWVGTANGIAIIKNCIVPGTSTPCEAEIPYVNYDNYSGYLFAGSDVKTIAVDAANRKWIGTADGAWLISPDAQQLISHFNTNNSPLPSDVIQKIAIDNATGDVYIGTDNGLVSYHGTASEPTTDNQSVEIFPNPVPPGYTGTIGIKGLVANADVRITDIDGQLVYKTRSLGGQAVWDGKDYTGHRPQTGIYSVFVSSADGRHTYAGKIAFLQ